MISRIAEWVKNLFSKPEPFYATPQRYGLIEFTAHAKKLGVFEDINKELKIIEGTKTVKILPYSEELIEAFQEKYELPIVDLTQADMTLPIDSIDYPGVVEE